jgi:2-hydroxychromene-2-carboxylate isomerase/Arc/MetJ family transcription regulator
MRTEIEIDDELLGEATRLSGLGTTRAVVEEGLRKLIRLKNQEAMLKLSGKIRWEGNLEESRRSREFVVREPEPRTLTVYIDYKSPYAYLAKDLVYDLQQEFGVSANWLPYELDIGGFLGTARVDAEGRVLEESRNAHQWRRVRYSYMDCRRQARKRGLVIRGTQKIWDSRLALAGMLWAKRRGEHALRRYHDIVFDRFWKRELDIEDPAVVGAVLAEAGADANGFADWAEAEGRGEVERIGRAAEQQGVFGVPSFVLGGELFWGREHLPDIREALGKAA